MPTKMDLLESVEIFQDLSPAEVRDIGQQFVMMAFEAGHIFYMPSDPGEVLFTLKKGRVQLYRISPDGRKLVVAVLQPGAVFGQMALVGQHLHRTFAQALDDCLVCIMSRVEVERLLIDKPLVALRFLDALGRRLEDVEQRLEETAFKRIPQRMAGLLVRLNAENGAEGIVRGYTHQYLADMLGIYRETATQSLNHFQQAKLIRIGRKVIEILDIAGLEAICAEA